MKGVELRSGGIAVHTSSAEKSWAVINGILIGSGIIYPPVGLIGVISSIVGGVEVELRKIKIQGAVVAQCQENLRKPPSGRSLDCEIESFLMIQK